MNNPLVAVFMVTYNHENYIAQAIESVIMQKTPFPIKLFIGEDCSEDQTSAICLKYKEKNPEIIEVRLNKQNIGALNNAKQIFEVCFASGAKYVAMLEGDDYWTDPYKLQKQVEFLESNKEYAICHHNMQVIYEDNREPHLSNSPTQKPVTTIEDLAHGNYIYTASCLYRNGLIKEFPYWWNDAPVGDYALHMLNAQFGKIRFFEDVMGVYRVHKGGTWENKNYIFRIEKMVELLDLMKNHFTQEINDIFIQTQSNYYSDLIKYYHNNAEKCKYYSKLLIDSNALSIIELNRKIEKLRNKNEAVLNSKTYKVGAFMLKPYSFLKRILNL